MGPAATMLTPPPAAITADRLLMEPLTSDAANSSRMMPKESGTRAPPTPWTTRATIRTPMLGARAARRQPTATVTRTATSVRFLPIRSPTRPRIGVKIEADRRYAVITQVTVDCEVCSACWTVGRAGAISDWSMANTPAPVARTAKVRRGEVRGMKKPLRIRTGCGRGRTGHGRTGWAGLAGLSRRCVRPHASMGNAPRLVKWRYPSTVAEAHLRFNLVPAPGGSSDGSAVPRQRDRRVAATAPKGRRPQLRRPAGRRTRGVRRERPGRLPGGHRPPGGRRHRHPLPELPDPPSPLRERVRG